MSSISIVLNVNVRVEGDGSWEVSEKWCKIEEVCREMLRGELEGMLKGVDLEGMTKGKESKGKESKVKKNEKKVVIEESTDLLAKLLKEHENEKEVTTTIGNESVNEIEKEVDLKGEKEAEKESKKAALKAAKEAAKESKKAELKAAKEAAKESKKAEVKAAKEAAKESKKAEVKAAKEAVKENKKKETKKKETKKKETNSTPPPSLSPSLEEEEELEEDNCVIITYEGNDYIRSIQTNVVYNMEEEVIGKYNPESKKIEFDEMKEDDYDE